MPDRQPVADPGGLYTSGVSRNDTDRDAIRTGVVKGVPAVLRDLGFDPDRIILDAGLAPEMFDNDEDMVPLAVLGRLMGFCVKRTGSASFGLLVGGKATVSSFGLVGLLMQHAPTVRAALDGFIAYSCLIDEAGAPTLEVIDGIGVWSYGVQPAAIPSAGLIVEAEIAAAFRVLKGLCGPDWRPSEVLLPRAAPIDGTPFRRFFQAPVRFGQEEAALVFDARWLTHRTSGTDKAIYERAAGRLEGLARRDSQGFAGQLRRTLRTTLLRKSCSADRTALRFAIHRRTMSRRLKAEGLSFQQLVNEVRYDVARQLIGGADMPLAEVAAALGYSEASALTRAFKRWSGQNPAAWRLEHRAEKDTPVFASNDSPA